VIGSKYEEYLKIIATEPENENIISGDPDVDLSKDNIYQTAFKKIGINDRYCCKRHILSHIDLIQKI
jgi:DNA-directed RNA polymerase subunit N (RpoN/RPB10)|tara:strand:+ start:73 stop:273 length:201 start_codon:yes stop_codon:yes gene_type:complete